MCLATPSTAVACPSVCATQLTCDHVTIDRIVCNNSHWLHCCAVPCDSQVSSGSNSLCCDPGNKSCTCAVLAPPSCRVPALLLSLQCRSSLHCSCSSMLLNPKLCELQHQPRLKCSSHAETQDTILSLMCFVGKVGSEQSDSSLMAGAQWW